MPGRARLHLLIAALAVLAACAGGTPAADPFASHDPAEPGALFGQPPDVQVAGPAAAQPGLPPRPDKPPLVACAEAVGSGADAVIDDFSGGDGQIRTADGRAGEWYHYNDDSKTGVQAPLSGAFAPEMGALHVTGSGFTAWGAGVGFVLHGAGMAPCLYDARRYAGVSLRARGNTAVRVLLLSAATTPLAEGGRCDPQVGDCWDAHGKTLALTDTWTVHTLRFADLAQAGWGVDEGPLASHELTGLQFQVDKDIAFDFWLDDIAFIPGATADAGATPEGGTSP